MHLQHRRPGLGPLLERSPGEEKGYPLQYSGLENSTDCIVHGVAKNGAGLSNFHFHFMGFPDSLVDRICLQCRRPWFDSGLGRSTGEGIGYPLQYSWASLWFS
ncbi:unnamed protein product [Rangifer tarandus platyrhynchus]|uniref:Uncharacterized protein n=2 Tax=Rangifer tarandus platyrhynchus TaxID=3082113 RepID=A0AC59ZCJ1_RANTA|nr:unnamed protein product [Rangifer tarandus platyrhynchus]